MVEYQSTAGVEKEAQKRARAERFGTAYQATDASGIIAACALLAADTCTLSRGAHSGSVEGEQGVVSQTGALIIEWLR